MTNPVLDALKETTVLASVSTRALGLERTDNRASDKAIADAGATAKAAKVKVNRLAGADAIHKAIVSAQNEACALLRANSQPFGEEEKWRLLPNARFEYVIRGMNPIKQEYDKQIDLLKQNAAAILQKARQNIGSFDVQLPTVDEMVEAYEMSLDFRPIPDSANFKGLASTTIEKLQAMHDRKLEAAVESAQRNTLERLLDPVERFVERMKEYDKRVERLAQNPDSKEKTGIFRDSVVTNIKDLYDVLGSFNISGDPRFTQLGNDLKDLVGIKPDDLRDSQIVRAQATERMKQVADNLRSWLA